ncbi:MAG: DUF86 domain-containing protein [Sedimenticolaceae bacterium]
MDRILIGQKLEALRHCITRIVEKCPANAGLLAEDADLQDIVVLNLTRSVQLCVDIASHLIAASAESAPATMGEALTTLAHMGVIEHDVAANLRRAVGFRNIAVHNYEKVDWAIVHAICDKHLDDFRRFASAIAPRLDRR